MRARLAIASRLSEGGLAERLLGPSDDPAARRTRRRLLVIVAVGAGLRLAWVLFASRDPQGLVDPAFYRRYAEQLAAGDGYVLVNGEPTAYYPVGYPAALAALFTVVLRTPLPDDLALATGLFQLVLGVATIVLTYVVGRRLFDDRVGLIAAGIVAVFPNLIFHTAVPLTETLFIFLVMAALARHEAELAANTSNAVPASRADSTSHAPSRAARSPAHRTSSSLDLETGP